MVMPTSTPKSKQPLQKQTLHNFFTPNAQKKSATTVARLKRSMSHQAIVIIDSDEDSTPKEKLKRKLSPCSSDVEIVGDISPEFTADGKKKRKKSTDKTIKKPVFVKIERETSTSSMVSKPKRPLSTHSVTKASSDDLFGVPSGPLARKENKSFVLPEAVTTPLDLNEDWDTGDEEQAFADPPANLDPDDDEVEIVDSQIVNNDPTCPMCGNEFSASEINRHVDQCLDEPEIELVSDDEPETGPSNRVYRSCDGKTGPVGNAFSILMTSHKEKQAWKEANVSEDRNFRPTKKNGGRRKAPFYKIMPGMPIAVDAFRYGTIPGIKSYFLTHAHSDHYTNLSYNWDSGPIYCSEATAKLILLILRVDKKWVKPLPMNVPTVIPETGGVKVTLIDANHCPGSCLFFFEGKQTVHAGDSTFKSQFIGSSRIFRYLHCGDFRASPAHVLHPAVKGKRVDTVYLDTTYLDPKFTFPPQAMVISACAELAKQLASEGGTGGPMSGKGGWFTKPKSKHESEPKSIAKTKPKLAQQRLLVLVGTYLVGKERIVKAVAKALNSKIYCDERKMAILRCQDDPELHSLLTSDPASASVHILPLHFLSSDKLKPYFERYKAHFTHCVGFRPTGWTFTPGSGTDLSPSVPSIISKAQSLGFAASQLVPARNSTSAIRLYGVPYSEHSSFFELTAFALSFEWVKMIATVNVGNEGSRLKMAKWVERWETERKKRGKIELVPPRTDEYW